MSPSLFEVDPYFLTISERWPRIALAVMIAMLATFLGLELAGRVHQAADRMSSRLWIAAGSVTLGTGIWSMNFVAMSAPVYPFKAGFETEPTFLSWIIAVVVSAIFLIVSERNRLRSATLWGYAVFVGFGLYAMHMVAMRAMVITPAVAYYPLWVTAAVVCAVGGSARAIAMTFRLSKLTGANQLKNQLRAAAVFGLSLSALHFLAMAGTDFPDDAVCLSADELDPLSLGGFVAWAALGFLALMLVVTSLERRAQQLASRLNHSLFQAEQTLQFVTFNDPLTGLPNRLVFQDRLEQAIHRSDRSGASVTVLLIELDGVAGLRHSFSQSELDSIVKEVSKRLVSSTRKADAVASVSNHQFMMLLDDEALTQESAQVATRICEAMALPCCTGLKEARVSVSIGITTYPADGGAADKIVNNANGALEAAKRLGGNCFCFFEPMADAQAKTASEWLEDLRLAVVRRELELHYQPKVHAQSSKIAGVEALLRWNHPTRGMVSPGVFIPLAEQFGLINELGSWVITEACRQMGEWREQGVRMRVAINLSVFQLRQAGLAQEITSALDRHSIEPRLLTCEITESGAMADTQSTLAVFKTLEAAGVQLSIDDFGTGYSSLSYLRRMPVRQLKIDRSFVMDLGKNDDARSIASAIIELAHALRLEVVAEGVETELQKQVLLDLGVDKFQGFLFARPMSASALTGWLTESNTGRTRFRESLFAA